MLMPTARPGGPAGPPPGAITDDDRPGGGGRRLALGNEIEFARLRAPASGADREALRAQVRHHGVTVAEQSSLIVDLGEWVISNALKQLAAWRTAEM